MNDLVRFERSEWSAVAEYASRVLVRVGLFTPKKIGSNGFKEARGKFSVEAVEEISRIVAAYHGWRHTPRGERGKGWPKDLDAFAVEIGVSVEKVKEAVYQARYHKWEEKYVPKVSKAARVSQIKDSLLHNVLRQDDVYPPEKVNANLYRTALQAEGAIQGTQKVTQVNIGSNVLNMPEGVTREMLDQRLEVVNRLAGRLSAREVTNDDPGPAELEEHSSGEGGSPGPESERPRDASQSPGYARESELPGDGPDAGGRLAR